ncbi:ClpXP protease specificity-enhancing factor SspB [Parvibaculum sp.]|uniref:SspB family protein n=1 Tax=Parvibaculum sp. TaxID=2024848 RepID=UPI000C8CB865|nr:ClpXP protease specificity-enhancing factor SspB [Parvibaculum sp.]MAB14866.1 hypothetical protein [Parvibaculum sp.]
MSEDQMRYDLLAQEALRGVIRKALRIARDEGLPGEHHFYISFRTGAPGVEISERLRSQYPEEITIVLQHQFWNLEVLDDYFSVDLTFNKVPERLVVPYAAVQGFFDPSVQFGLQFNVEGAPGSEAAPETGDQPAATEASRSMEEPLVKEENAEPEEEATGEVVSLDAFRKK